MVRSPSASSRRTDDQTVCAGARERRQRLPDVRQVLASPKEFAVDEEGRHAEDAGRFRRRADRVVFAPAIAGEKVVETRRVRAGLGQHRRDHSRVLDIEFAPPEAFEHPLVAAAPWRFAQSMPMAAIEESQILRVPRMTRPRLRACRLQSM
jgi:hypothetical protein